MIADPQTKKLVIPAVLVTGAARRIGKAISEDLAAHGYPVVIHCNQSVDDGEQLAQQIRDNGGQAAVVQADLSDASALQGLMDAASKPFGPIRLLINNASAFDDDRIGSLDPVLWDQHFALHLKAPVFLTEAMAKRLGPDESGLVVNIIDQRVWKLNPHFFSYTLSKTALWTATQTLAQALAPEIRVNAIGPGPTLPSSRQARADLTCKS
ncbi:SDR family oxidoreductase, partial [Paraburkholderia aspalathi]|nr:SDR family oxidoreductase [Paraburkholderia aspalathi]